RKRVTPTADTDPVHFAHPGRQAGRLGRSASPGQIDTWVSESGVANQRILIADDEPDIRLVLRTRLELEGFVVIEARDGAEAVRVAQTETPDLIVLDVMMPEMDGVEVCNRLRASFNTRNIPVIMLTARAGRDDKLSGLVQGANDYITKPFDLNELVQR